MVFILRSTDSAKKISSDILKYSTLPRGGLIKLKND